MQLIAFNVINNKKQYCYSNIIIVYSCIRIMQVLIKTKYCYIIIMTRFVKMTKLKKIIPIIKSSTHCLRLKHILWYLAYFDHLRLNKARTKRSERKQERILNIWGVENHRYAVGCAPTDPLVTHMLPVRNNSLD